MEKLGLNKFLDKKLDNLKSIQGGRKTTWTDEAGNSGKDYQHYNRVEFDDGVTIYN